MADTISAPPERPARLTPAAGERRAFLKWAGMTAALLGVAGTAGCNDGALDPSAGSSLTDDDFGLLNYAYALEQLEAAFYASVVAAPASDLRDGELAILTDIGKHEVAHREFLKTALGAKAIGPLEIDFAGLDLTGRDRVLEAARIFEDLRVAACNGMGGLLRNAEFLMTIGKIASVEARHAAVIRDLIAPKSPTSGFAGDDAIDAMGFDMAKPPSAVLEIISPYIKTNLTSSLP